MVAGLRLDPFCQGIKCFGPIGELGLFDQVRVMFNGFCKIAQLFFHGQVVPADKRKVVLAVEEFFYKEGLAYAATAINDNKLRLVTF